MRFTGFHRQPLRLGLTGVVAGALLVAAGFYLSCHVGFELEAAVEVPAVAAETGRPASRSDSSPQGSVVVQLSAERLAALGVETRPAEQRPMPRPIRATGRLEVDGGRIARVHSLVEGVVREISVDLGAPVTLHQVLAYVDSREVGEAKLALAKERANLESAREVHQWEATIHDNVTALLEELAKGIDPEQIEVQFRDRPLANHGEQVVAALARVRRAAADHRRVDSLSRQGILPEKQKQHALGEHESAQAAYRSLVEQTRFEVQQRFRAAQQRLREAEAAVAIARSQLLIFGFEPGEIDAMDPISDGERVAYYPVRAPLAGTVTARPSVLSQHVERATTLAELADLSVLRLRADLFEKDLEAIGGRIAQSLRFRTPSYPQREFTAKVLSVGHQVDDQTRAVGLLAAVDNRDGLLKPGMFVDVEFDAGDDRPALQVPAAAIQHHDGASFAFVPRGEGRFERRELGLGRSARSMVEVTAGLREGEQVVVRGGFALKSEMLKDLLVE